MPDLWTQSSALLCPGCGGEKFLRHSHFCGPCYEAACLRLAGRGRPPGPPALPWFRPARRPASYLHWPTDFLVGATLPAGLVGLALGVGSLLAHGVLTAGRAAYLGLTAALAFVGGFAWTLGGLSVASLLYLGTRRPAMAWGFLFTTLYLPLQGWRSARRKIQAWRDRIAEIREEL